MRILVTGGAGFIGSNVVDRFVALGHEVAVFDNLSSGFREFVPAKARFYEGDLADATAVDAAIADFRPEIVDHHAAQIDVRHSVADPIFDARVNVLGSIGLMQACHAHGVRKVVYASTGGALYGEGRHAAGDRRPSGQPRGALRREQAHGRALPLHLEAAPRARLHGAALPERLRAAPEPARRSGRERHLHRSHAGREAPAHLWRRHRGARLPLRGRRGRGQRARARNAAAARCSTWARASARASTTSCAS